LLHDAAAKPIPAKASLPDILTYQIDRDDYVETSSANLKSLCIFVVASIRGEDVDGYYDEYL
jgi:hypothetical protein